MVYESSDLQLLVKRTLALRDVGARIAWINGCFDIIHSGHVDFIHRAKNHCGITSYLVVGMNSDESIRLLKGLERPIISQRHRARILQAIKGTDDIIIFNGMTCDRELSAIRPNVVFKIKDNLRIPEQETIEEIGAAVVLLDKTYSISTSSIINRIKTGLWEY